MRDWNTSNWNAMKLATDEQKGKAEPGTVF